MYQAKHWIITWYHNSPKKFDIAFPVIIIWHTHAHRHTLRHTDTRMNHHIHTHTSKHTNTVFSRLSLNWTIKNRHTSTQTDQCSGHLIATISNHPKYTYKYTHTITAASRFSSYWSIAEIVIILNHHKHTHKYTHKYCGLYIVTIMDHH